jgi:2-amino-4-hydroxy-6-hydroxymethyldihydropteridine diphosphokinase
MATVYLGLGTNVGDRLAQLRAALSALRPEKCSSVYETEPWGVLDQARFLNLCCRVSTTLEADAFHAVTKSLEQELGRQPDGQRWGPRPIDIDLLCYDNLSLHTAQLTIPHPRIQDRAFVLKPLAELAPTLRLPGLNGSVSELLAAIADADRQAWIVAPPLC